MENAAFKQNNKKLTLKLQYSNIYFESSLSDKFKRDHFNRTVIRNAKIPKKIANKPYFTGL